MTVKFKDYDEFERAVERGVRGVLKAELESYSDYIASDFIEYEVRLKDYIKSVQDTRKNEKEIGKLYNKLADLNRRVGDWPLTGDWVWYVDYADNIVKRARYDEDNGQHVNLLKHGKLYIRESEAEAEWARGQDND